MSHTFTSESSHILAFEKNFQVHFLLYEKRSLVLNILQTAVKGNTTLGLLHILIIRNVSVIQTLLYWSLYEGFECFM